MPRTLKLLPAVCALAALFSLCAPAALARQTAPAQGPADDFERGKRLLAQGNADAAADVLGRVAESHKTDADVWYEFGLALTHTHRQKEARKAFERAVELRDTAPARTGLAFTQFLLRKTDDAEREDARRNLTTGTVRLRAVLAADGRVRHIMVVESLPDGLTERSIAAARLISFTPATLDGRRVSQYVILEYNFNVETRYTRTPPQVVMPKNPRGNSPLPPPNRP
ncbi:MAG: energy transducer TonB [Acidobacteria bacterium]|nr:energy transducer TonB [Acidobacteriota bacterium]